MKISAAALSFLVLATALGSPAHGSPVHGSLDHEFKMVINQLGPSINQQVAGGTAHHPLQESRNRTGNLVVERTRSNQLSHLGVQAHREPSDGSSQGMHHPADCCSVYTSRKIRCAFMESYFETTSRCSQPAVIFLTKRQQKVCANPGDEDVQKCLRSLNQLSEERLGTILLKEKRY